MSQSKNAGRGMGLLEGSAMRKKIILLKMMGISFVLFFETSFAFSLKNKYKQGSFQWQFENQRLLALDLPLHRYNILVAHNSWANGPEVYANQRWNQKELLENGIRGFMLDVHEKAGKITLCHGTCGSFYSFDSSYEKEIKELASFLIRNPTEIIHIEFEMETFKMDKVLAPLKRYFGNRILKISDMDKLRLKWPMTLREILKKKKNVIITGNNSDGDFIWNIDPWNYVRPGSLIHQRTYLRHAVKNFSRRRCSISNQTIPNDKFSEVWDSKLTKEVPILGTIFEETGNIDERNIPAIMECGVSRVSADRWNKKMVRAAIWSWAPGSPKRYNCAGIDFKLKKWRDYPCRTLNRFACQSKKNPNLWRISKIRGKWDQGFLICKTEAPHNTFKFAVPRTPKSNRWLKNTLLRNKRSKSNVWLRLIKGGSDWP